MNVIPDTRRHTEQTRGPLKYLSEAAPLTPPKNVAEGLLKKSRLLRHYAPRNDTKYDFSVIARPAKQAVAISNLGSGLFQQPRGHL